MLSTCLAAMVGTVAIGVVIFGSLDQLDTRDGVLPALQKLREARAPVLTLRQSEGLNWSMAKTDRLQIASGAMASKQIIHEQVQVRRDNRPFIQIRPYMRIMARLAPVPPNKSAGIPAFNPLKLYAATATDADAGADGALEGRTDVAVRVLELLGGILPGEDGQELDTQEVTDLVARVQDSELDLASMRPGFQPEGADGLAAGVDGLRQRGTASAEPNTTVLAKSVVEADDEDDDLEQKEVRVVRAARGDTVVRILQRMGAEGWQARAMVEAGRSLFPESQFQPGQEVHVTLVPSHTRSDKMEPARFSIFADGHDHKVTVHRNAAGEFVASASPLDAKMARAALADSDQAHSSSLYASLYQAALVQGIPTDTVTQILRIHAYETDFRRRIRNGDAVDFFFDLKDEGGAESAPGELLYTSVIVGGEVQRFWRFRTPDGVVDYYDEAGNNSKKFLMKRPVRGETVRLVSGFGVRHHPVLNVPRMHTGVDWAAPIGTPILAAGNGIVEYADRKGQNGNYIRIRHANGYTTAYSHMVRFGTGLQVGGKIRQGQVIGFVGCTGLCTGPHLHYEVLVNTRYVDPLQIQVPRERQLTGRQLQDFLKERARIDELMRRAPVMTASR